MLVARVTRSLLLLATVMLGLGPVQAMLANVCTPAVPGVAVLGMTDSGCDCDASRCEVGAPATCGQCLAVASDETGGTDLARPMGGRSFDIVDNRTPGLAPEPSVPPPRLAA